MRIWLFYAQVGGGHHSAAQAIAKELGCRPNNAALVRPVAVCKINGRQLLNVFNLAHDFGSDSGV